MPVNEPVEDTFGRVPLLARPAQVLGEPRFDDVLEPGSTVQPWRLPWMPNSHGNDRHPALGIAGLRAALIGLTPKESVNLGR